MCLRLYLDPHVYEYLSLTLRRVVLVVFAAMLIALGTNCVDTFVTVESDSSHIPVTLYHF